jgi:catechol 2,3-dioxygenase-like lactoylglutathione lyase family enzyme
MMTLKYALCLVLLCVAAKGQRPPIVGIANIAIKVSDLEKARNFYQHVLGLQEAFTVKDVTWFKVNDRQYVEVSPTLKSDSEDRLIHIAFETADARKLRDYLASRGVEVPAKVSKDASENLSFEVKDPNGHMVEFVQYLPGSTQSRSVGKFLSDARVSDHILHVGIQMEETAAADRFYQDILGFRLLWKGGPADDRLNWISLLVPDGSDWVEYMVSGPNPPPRQLGGMHHFCLGVTDIQSVYTKVVDRGYKPPRGPVIARDGRWLMNLYSPDFTRAEVMIRKPVQTPCCTPLHDPYID